MMEDYEGLPFHSDIERYFEAVQRLQRDERANLVRYAPVLCSCTRWYDWRAPGAPQEGCYVHTTVAFSPSGEWM